VIVDDAELRRFRQLAETVGMTTSEWARQALRRAEREMSTGDPARKLAAIRVAVAHDFPTGDIDEMLAEIEAKVVESDQEQARGQLELFGALLTSLAGRTEDPELHTVALDERRQLEGTWDEIVDQMHLASGTARTGTVEEYMATEARRAHTLTGLTVSTSDAESFVRAIAHAGLVRIVK